MKANGKMKVFKPDDSPAFRELYVQLLLSIKIENYSDYQKIFYPPKKLYTADTPQTDAKVGTPAYHAPCRDVVMFHDRSGSTAGLYELMHAISGRLFIRGMSGTVKDESVSAP